MLVSSGLMEISNGIVDFTSLRAVRHCPSKVLTISLMPGGNTLGNQTNFWASPVSKKLVRYLSGYKTVVVLFPKAYQKSIFVAVFLGVPQGQELNGKDEKISPKFDEKSEYKEIFFLRFRFMCSFIPFIYCQFCIFQNDMGFVNNTGTDQSAHPRSLISAFVICFLESIISRLATSEISIY